MGTVLGMFSLPPGVGAAVLGVLSRHHIVPLDRRELLRAAWSASSPGKSALKVDVAMDEVPALAIEQINSFVGCFIIIIPHRLFTTPLSRYIS